MNGMRNEQEHAAWLADKIVAGGDYAKEAAQMLRRWPAQPPKDECGQWTALTDKDRERAMNSMPNMLEGFMKTWGWLHFAKAIEEICREKNFNAAEPAQPVALSTLTDDDIEQFIYERCKRFVTADMIPAIRALAASAPAQQAGQGWKLVPVEPTTAMISAMACSQARDAEGQFPSLMDLIDYSDENKTHTVLKAAYQSMLDAAPAHEPSTPPQPVAAEVAKDTRRLDWLEQQGYAYGFEDMHEGNRWMIDGPYRTIRIAIDDAMAGTGSDESAS